MLLYAPMPVSCGSSHLWGISLVTSEIRHRFRIPFKIKELSKLDVINLLD